MSRAHEGVENPPHLRILRSRTLRLPFDFGDGVYVEHDSVGGARSPASAPPSTCGCRVFVEHIAFAGVRGPALASPISCGRSRAACLCSERDVPDRFLVWRGNAAAMRHVVAAPTTAAAVEVYNPRRPHAGVGTRIATDACGGSRCFCGPSVGGATVASIRGLWPLWRPSSA